MKVLVVYDTVSISRVTEAVAKIISETLRQQGLDVDTFYVANTDKTTMKNYDAVVVGAPTMAFRATKDIMQFLNSLPNNEFIGKSAAAFSTQIQSRLSGSAAKGIESKLKNLGFKQLTPPLISYVERKPENKDAWQLKQDENEKAKIWAQEIAQALLSKK